jgi:hypothetical protein
MTHTERTHLLFGTGLALMGLLAMLAARRRHGAAAAAWPVLAFCIGFVLFIPVESQTRTYRAMEWGSFLATLVPDHPASWVADWLERARAGHVVQHKLGGLLAMAAGLVELGIARRWLEEDRWTPLLPLCLIATGAAFGIHGGSTHHLPFAAEQTHHRLLGLGLAAGGVTLGLHRAGVLSHRGWALLWPLLAMLVGLNMALFYRLPPAAAGQMLH